MSGWQWTSSTASEIVAMRSQPSLCAPTPIRPPSPRDDPQRAVNRRPLRIKRLLERCPHPDVALLPRGQYHRHHLRVDRSDDGGRIRREDAVEGVGREGKQPKNARPM